MVIGLCSPLFAERQAMSRQPELSPIRVTVEKDRPELISVERGDRVKVNLNFPSGSAFRWKITNSGTFERNLRRIGDPIETRPPMNPQVPVLGQTSFLEFTFETVKAGRAVVDFELRDGAGGRADSYTLAIEIVEP